MFKRSGGCRCRISGAVYTECFNLADMAELPSRLDEGWALPRFSPRLLETLVLLPRMAFAIGSFPQRFETTEKSNAIPENSKANGGSRCPT